jgi:anti-repressor protein
MTELVVMKDQQAVTTSVAVAETFGKQAGHVNRDIEALEKDVSNFGEMFVQGTVKDSYGRSRKMYYMNRDGFTLLAMGFTGKKAMKFKLQYIEAFNQLEAQAKQLQQDSYMIQDPVERANKWIEEEKERQALATENKALKPMAEIGTKLLQSDDLISVNSLAKLLSSNGLTIGRNRLFTYLRNSGYLINRGEDRNLPTQKAIDLGLFKVVEKPYTRDGEIKLGKTTKVTAKGQRYFLIRLTKVVA